MLRQYIQLVYRNEIRCASIYKKSEMDCEKKNEKPDISSKEQISLLNHISNKLSARFSTRHRFRDAKSIKRFTAITRLYSTQPILMPIYKSMLHCFIFQILNSCLKKIHRDLPSWQKSTVQNEVDINALVQCRPVPLQQQHHKPLHHCRSRLVAVLLSSIVI
jgi:hypothetical protein